MSLAVLADHMASKGRGPDSMLIHMSPREVQGLQALAENHGGSLTINPETGLPEAGFLDKLLPTIIGAGLTYFGGVPPHVAAMMVGGVETVRTGDIGKGISAGLGAYGGANLTSGLMEAGTSTIGAAEAAKGLTMSPEYLAEFGGDSAKDALLQQQVADRMAAATPYEKLSSGFDAFKNNPMGMTKSLAMPAAMAFGPAILAEANVKQNMPQTLTKPGMITPYNYFGGQYVAGSPYQATPTRGAKGGLMGMAVGGIAGYGDGDDVPRQNGMAQGGMYDFAQRSEPVVRMARGGIAHFVIGGEVKDEIDRAYAAGDYGRVNELAQENKITAADVASTYQGFDTSGLAGLGINLYTPDGGGGAPVDYFKQQFAPDVSAPAEPEPTYIPTPDYFEQQFAPDVSAPVATPTATDSALAAYQSGNYGEASRLLAEAGMSAQDVVSKYGLSQADAATVAKNLSYTGDMSGIQYAAPPPVVQAATAPVVQAATAPAYTQYTPEQMGSYLSNPVNQNVNLQDAIKATNADPAAVNAYIASIADPFRGSTDTTGGSGVLGIYNRMVAEGIDPSEMYKAEIANDPKYAGYTQAMIQKAYDLSKGAYALSDAKKGVVSDKDWVKFMDDNKYSIDDAAQAFGLSRNEVKRRYDAVKAAEVVTKDTVTGGTGNDVIATKSGYHINDDGVLVPNISATQTTTTNVATPTDISTAASTALPVGVSGAGITTINPNGTITTRPNIPGIGDEFTGIKQVRDTYEKGGGSLGVNKDIFTPKTYKELEDRFKLTGGSKQAMDYLTGKTKYTPIPYTEDGQISKSYAESVMKLPRALSSKMYIFKNGKYEVNPDYAIPTYDKDGKKSLNLTNADVKTFMDKKPSTDAFYTWATTNNLSPEQIAQASGRPINEISKLFTGAKDLVGDDGKIDQTKVDEKADADLKANFDATAYLKANQDVMDELTAGKANFGSKDDLAAAAWEHYQRYGKAQKRPLKAAGGLMNMAMARGGMAQQFDLGGYSDGGRLLRGPGDGVSDSIPATIGNKRPARLADGEFVVPARIVSELGNGSTEAGARKLYAMMDRVQSARRGTVGKGRVAKNSRSEKYLPA